MATSSKTLGALLQRSTIDDHEEILKACNATLKQSKDDLDAQHAKLVALIKLDCYEDALRILEEGGDKLKHKAKVERAYALYKVGDLEQAKSIARAIADNRGARYVEAQASYRSEDFTNAAKLYQNLAGSQAALENEESELRINSGATDAQLEWQRQGHLVQKKKPAREDLEAFETAYNAACGSIARGDLAQGEILLKRAKDLCASVDDLTDQEKTAELVPISVQQLYVLSKLGKTEEAEHLASQIVLQDVPDLSTRQIAQINQMVGNSKTHNPYLSHRLFHGAEKLPKSDKFFALQENRMLQNGLALDLLANKSDGVIKLTKRVLSDSSPTLSAHINNLSVLNAAAHAQSQSAKLGLKHMLPQLEKRPRDIGLALTVIQLYVLTSKTGSAITILEGLLKHLSTPPSDPSILYAPGLIALQIALYATQGRKSEIRNTLSKAASHWQSAPSPPLPLLRAAGLSLLSSPNASHQSTARAIFSTLHSQDSSSPFATAGYIASHALTSPSSVTSLAATLTPVPRLIANIDTDHLEAAGVPALPSSATNPHTRKRALDDKPKPAKKRVRKSRLAKDYDANRTPDPERWLPLRDRSTYRPKGRKGRQKAAEKTRGGAVSEKPSDKTAGGDGVVKAAEKPPAGGGGGAKGKGGKKKGKK